MDFSTALDRFWTSFVGLINHVGAVDVEGASISDKISQEAGLQDVYVDQYVSDGSSSGDYEPRSDASDVDDSLVNPCNTILDRAGEAQILVSVALLDYIRDTYLDRGRHHHPPPRDPPTWTGGTFVSVRVHEGAYLVPRRVLLRVMAVIMAEIEHYDDGSILDSQNLVFEELLERDLHACGALEYTGAEAADVSVPERKPDLEDDGYFLVCRDDSPVLQFIHTLRQKAGHRAPDRYAPCALPYVVIAYLVGHHNGFFAEENTAPDPSSVSAFVPRHHQTTTTDGIPVPRLRPGDGAEGTTLPSPSPSTQANVAESVQWLRHGTEAFSPTARLDHLLRGPRPRQSQWFMLTYPYYLAWYASQEL